MKRKKVLNVSLISISDHTYCFQDTQGNSLEICEMSTEEGANVCCSGHVVSVKLGQKSQNTDNWELTGNQQFVVWIVS